MRPRLGVVAAVLVAVAGLAATAQPAAGSRYLRVGIYDEAQTLYGPVAKTFATFRELHVQEVRLNLYWGGPYGVATKRPANPTNPDDPAYNWTLYDRTVDYAAQNGVRVLFSIYGTPSWANGGKGVNHAPTKAADLRAFAYAAAQRYSGKFVGSGWRRDPGGARMAGVERAEQPDLPVTAVQALGPKVDHAEPDRLRADLQCGVLGRARDADRRANGLPAVRRRLAATTSPRARGPRSRRSLSWSPRTRRA